MCLSGFLLSAAVTSVSQKPTLWLISSLRVTDPAPTHEPCCAHPWSHEIGSRADALSHLEAYIHVLLLRPPRAAFLVSFLSALVRRTVTLLIPPLTVPHTLGNLTPMGAGQVTTRLEPYGVCGVVQARLDCQCRGYASIVSKQGSFAPDGRTVFERECLIWSSCRVTVWSRWSYCKAIVIPDCPTAWVVLPLFITSARRE